MKTITEARTAVSNIIQKKDDRMFIIVGPCSIHDTIAAKEYGKFFLIMIIKQNVHIQHIIQLDY